MIQLLRTILGAVLIIFALVIVCFALWAATFTESKIRSPERDHLEQAVQFVRAQELRTGRIPSTVEFNSWAEKMDTEGFRFDGLAFALKPQCGSKSTEFCITFWTGDTFVTYRSWQKSMDTLRINDSPLPSSLMLLIIGLGLGMIGRLLIVSKKVLKG